MRRTDFAILAILLSLLLAVAVPNVRQQMNRERQKRSMADMRSLATALEARATDLNSYAIVPAAVSSTASDFASMAPAPPEMIERALKPLYIRKLPRQDGWGNDFEVRVSERSYVIRSRGSDDRFDASSYTNRITHSFAEDLVFSNGNFVQYPESTCTQ
ncbi:MAG TPA: hypothetical protein VFP80_12570 [Thermoanaerobaculia bacterium]|nr:hypothetical protein [Thermoanaerobaculia bacterium]